VLDWSICDGAPTLSARTSYRIDSADKGLTVLKRKNGGWQKVNAINSDDLIEVVREIESKAQ